jgi:hypothetical protein
MVQVSFEMGTWKQVVGVGQNWTLSSLRREVLILLGHGAPNEFIFYILEDNKDPMKVNRRNEDKFTASDVLSPKRLQIRSSE